MPSWFDWGYKYGVPKNSKGQVSPSSHTKEYGGGHDYNFRLEYDRANAKYVAKANLKENKNIEYIFHQRKEKSRNNLLCTVMNDVGQVEKEFYLKPSSSMFFSLNPQESTDPRYHRELSAHIGIPISTSGEITKLGHRISGEGDQTVLGNFQFLSEEDYYDCKVENDVVEVKYVIPCSEENNLGTVEVTLKKDKTETLVFNMKFSKEIMEFTSSHTNI